MTSENILSAALNIIQFAKNREIVLRLIGGLAIKQHCPSAYTPVFNRKNVDIDFIALKRQSKGIIRLFDDLGYIPNKSFNAIHGDRRLMFFDSNYKMHVDIFLDIFEMCHVIDLTNRLTIDPFTISLADLLLTKLQVVQINEKDIKDIICILLDHEVGDSDDVETINGQYIAKLCSEDWGLFTTVTENINRIPTHVSNWLKPNEMEKVNLRAQKLLEMIDAAPKTIKWKIRAKIGKRMPWYNLPEEAKRGVKENLI